MFFATVAKVSLLKEYLIMFICLLRLLKGYVTHVNMLVMVVTEVLL